MKCRWYSGCRNSHRFTAGVLCVASLSSTRWMLTPSPFASVASRVKAIKSLVDTLGVEQVKQIAELFRR